jgi:hypothetical protein
MYFPSDPHVTEWMDHAHLFLLNGISIPADANDDTVVAGRAIRDWHIGANFFPNYALDHHQYLNVGYMAICLSNVAMLHYSCTFRQQEAPPALYHHARDLWGLLRRLLFADGRLLRIGGDSRIRYCYCQDYVVPTLVLATDIWRDPHAAELLQNAIKLASREQALSDDGRFLCSRLQAMVHSSPLYYTRLEADRAVVLSQAAAWLGRGTITPAVSVSPFEASVAGGWEERELGAAFHRSATRFVSWNWRACENPQGMCLPPCDGDLAEWAENLSGRIRGLGNPVSRKIIRHSQMSFDGGFVTSGAYVDASSPAIRSTDSEAAVALHQVAFAALPDDHTVVRLEFARLEHRRCYLQGWEGVMLEIPNDIFNHGRRTYECALGRVTLEAYVGTPKVTDLKSNWVSVEDKIGLIGLYGAQTWSVLQRGHRIGGRSLGSILTDTLCFQLSVKSHDLFGPLIVLDNGSIIIASVDARSTAAIAASAGARRLQCGNESIRAVVVLGLDEKCYLLCANFDEAAAEPLCEARPGTWKELGTGREFSAGTQLAVPLLGGQTRLLVYEG